METILDRFGRIVVPKQIRDHLGLLPGDVLNIEEEKEEIVLTPVHEESNIVKKDGVLVFSGTSVGDISQALKNHRKERMTKNTSRK